MPRCPTCKRQFTASADVPRPFCCQRCKLADLDNWLSGRYVVSEQLPFGEGDDGLLPEDLIPKPPGKHDE